LPRDSVCDDLSKLNRLHAASLLAYLFFRRELMMDEVLDLDGVAQADLIRRRQITPLELVDAAITRIERVNPQINAVIIPLFDKARTLARSSSLPQGPLTGVPFLLKDLFCTSGGDPQHDGMRLLRDLKHTAPHDSYLAAKFNAAGLITLGKTNTPELGLNATTEPEAYGASRNPWNPDHSTGGSSGGSAAAVAARLVPIAHANDGGGSIRIPASECGLVGLKPTRGRVSLGPDFGDAWHGFAIEGVVTRSVRDTAVVLDAIAGNMPGDPYSAPPQSRRFHDEISSRPSKLKIGLMRREPRDGAPLHLDCRTAVENTGRLLESLGHHVEESHPAALDENELMWQHFVDIVSCHAVFEIELYEQIAGRKINAEDVEVGTWYFVERGHDISAARYLTSIQWVHGWARRVASWWSEQEFNLLLTPTIATPPPPLGALVPTRDNPEAAIERLTATIQFTPQFNATGQPAITLPLHWNPDGLPIGIQLVAPFGREDLLLQTAAQVEEAHSWQNRRPPIRA
jgi:amidase